MFALFVQCTQERHKYNRSVMVEIRDITGSCFTRLGTVMHFACMQRVPEGTLGTRHHPPVTPFFRPPSTIQRSSTVFLLRYKTTMPKKSSTQDKILRDGKSTDMVILLVIFSSSVWISPLKYYSVIGATGAGKSSVSRVLVISVHCQSHIGRDSS